MCWRPQDPNRTDVRFWHKADIPIALSNVRFRGQSGWRRALHDDPHLRDGLNVHEGQITCRAVADALKLPYTPADQALQQ
jgi:alanine dehydrogenase